MKYMQLPVIIKLNNAVKVSNDFDILRECEIVFVCSPINNVLEVLDKLENIVSKDCIVTDVASVKEFVTHKKRPYKFIPSHPMAGKEKNGYDVSDEDLFIGAKWILTPYYYQETQNLTEIIKEMGAIPIITTANEHDKAVALISHLPMYISQCLFYTAKDNLLAMKIASSGFRDTTRLAGTNLTLAKDMMKYNGENIEIMAKEFIKNIETLKKDYNDFVLEPLQKQRRGMYSSDGKNIL